MTPKMRLRPSASSASTPPSSSPLTIDSRRKMSMRLTSHPHVGLADELVLAHRRGRAGGADPPDLEEIGAVDEIEHLTHVLLDDEDGEALLADAADERKDLLD